MERCTKFSRADLLSTAEYSLRSIIFNANKPPTWYPIKKKLRQLATFWKKWRYIYAASCTNRTGLLSPDYIHVHILYICLLELRIRIRRIWIYSNIFESPNLRILKTWIRIQKPKNSIRILDLATEKCIKGFKFVVREIFEIRIYSNLKSESESESTKPRIQILKCSRILSSNMYAL